MNVTFCVLLYFRASWLKELNPDAELLFSMVAEVFIFWVKSHVRMTHQTGAHKCTTHTVKITVSVMFSTEFQMGGTKLRGPK